MRPTSLCTLVLARGISRARADPPSPRGIDRMAISARQRVYSARPDRRQSGISDPGYLLIRKRRLFMRITARIMEMAQDRAAIVPK
jgi:hypothetical protein